MRNGFLVKITLAFIVLMTTSFVHAADASDPLPSWQDTTIKHNIISFVKAITDHASKDYVAPKDRIATFDNDGTLWVEQPLYTQAIFMISRYQILAKGHKDWPAITEKNLTQQNIERLLETTSAGISVAKYNAVVKEWLNVARNPRFNRAYTELIYQPMLEVINYLQKNDFEVYIVSGGGQDFIRVFAPQVYHIEADNVIGSSLKTKYVYNNGKPELIRVAQPFLICDNAGKPQAINLFIGKKPIIAFGNSDGDRQMLEWTQSNTAKHLMLLVHHDDAQREYAYDTASKVGTFSASLMKEAEDNKWQVISMKNDWKVIFPFIEKQTNAA